MMAKYAAVFKTTPNQSQGTTSQLSNSTLTAPPTAHLQPQNASILQTQPTLTQRNVSTVSSSQTLPGATAGNANLSFLELCVNTGPHLKSLAEIETTYISSDGELFETLRKHYLRLRRFRSQFWLLKPASVSFVRVSLLSSFPS